MKRLDAFHSLKTHPMMGRDYSRLSRQLREQCEAFIIENDHLNRDDFAEKTNRWGMDSARPKQSTMMWALVLAANGLAHPIIKPKRGGNSAARTIGESHESQENIQLQRLPGDRRDAEEKGHEGHRPGEGESARPGFLLSAQGETHSGGDAHRSGADQNRQAPPTVQVFEGPQERINLRVHTARPGGITTWCGLLTRWHLVAESTEDATCKNCLRCRQEFEEGKYRK